jgi:hypothetical protein
VSGDAEGERLTVGWQNVVMFLGEDLLAWLVLALGGALFAGNALAVVKPPPATKEGDLARAPLARSVVMAVVGLVAAVWALASLISG